jgi:hypothetical protein
VREVRGVVVGGVRSANDYLRIAHVGVGGFHRSHQAVYTGASAGKGERRLMSAFRGRGGRLLMSGPRARMFPRGRETLFWTGTGCLCWPIRGLAVLVQWPLAWRFTGFSLCCGGACHHGR